MDNLGKIEKFDWCKPDWCLPSSSKETNELLRQCTELPTTEPSDDVDDLIRKSKEFPIPFAVQTVRLEQLKERKSLEELKRNIASTYPLIHERVLLLMTHFLIYKREFGTSIEKDFYKDMSVPQFIDRILQKRAAAFLGPEDVYKLLTGEQGRDGWDSIGSLTQKPPLTLDNCLSYDELKIAAMVYVSSWTVCINDGTRKNSGLVREKEIEQEAVIIGTIGPRFQRVRRMDFEDILIYVDQNTSANGYGERESAVVGFFNSLKPADVKEDLAAKRKWRQMWSEFYQIPSYKFRDMSLFANKRLKSDLQRYTERFVSLTRTGVFDNEAYYKRIVIIAETVLLEAERRASEVGRHAFVNVIGCGLGVWKISSHQNDVYVLTFLERIHALLQRDALTHVTDVNFAYIPLTLGLRDILRNSTGAKNVSDETNTSMEKDDIRIFLTHSTHPKGGINIQFKNREPSSKLTGEHEGKLLIMMYPWDSNAHPGNEFWFGTLNTSGDPACASSTQVTELHNAHVNPRVAGEHTRVALARPDRTTAVHAIKDYCKVHVDNFDETNKIEP